MTAYEMICGINAVEGFNPMELAVEYTDLSTNETRKRLPVMAQMAWFRLKYPEGRVAISVQPARDCFVATARVYRSYNDPPEHFLAEATASRAYNPEKATISPREWAQTAAVGIALRNAGFGLQFHAAGEGFDSPAVNELDGEAAEALVVLAAHRVAVAFFECNVAYEVRVQRYAAKAVIVFVDCDERAEVCGGIRTAADEPQALGPPP